MLPFCHLGSFCQNLGASGFVRWWVWSAKPIALLCPILRLAGVSLSHFPRGLERWNGTFAPVPLSHAYRQAGQRDSCRPSGFVETNPKRTRSPLGVEFVETNPPGQIGRTKPIWEIGRTKPPPVWAQITRPLASSIRCMCSTLAASRMGWPSRAPASGLTRPQTSMPLMRKNTRVSMPSGSVTSIAAST
jgi:hypothetical protein